MRHALQASEPLSRRQEGRSCTLTGPETLTYDEMAEALSAVLRRPIRHVKEPRDHRR
jgi:uncharacterized protein YbjT (DUF2867 family)